MLARSRVAPPWGSGFVLGDHLPVFLADRIKRKGNDRFRGRPTQPQKPVAAPRGLEFIVQLEGRHLRDNPKQVAGKLERCFCFQDGKIAPTNPELSREQPEKPLLAGSGTLLWLRFKGDDVSPFPSSVLVGQTLPNIPVT